VRAQRAHERAQQLQLQADWSAAEKELRRHITLLQYEPLVPQHWAHDLPMLPSRMFGTGPVPIYSKSSNDFRGKKKKRFANKKKENKYKRFLSLLFPFFSVFLFPFRLICFIP
jgi:hypothetical protein